MVTITNYHVRKNNEGETFISLELQGDIEMIQSASTGNFYASAKRCSMSSTFSEDVAKTLIGKQLPGRIDRVECEPYDFTVKQTGEVISLTHTYVYSPDEKEPELASKPVRVMVGA